MALLAGGRAHATTYTLTSSQSAATIQGIITSASAGDTINFGAGTFNISAGLNLKCGITYLGVAGNYPYTTVLNGTFAAQSANIFNLASGSGYAIPCTTPTTISFFNFENAGGIYVQGSYTNLTIEFNAFTNIPCCNGGAVDNAIEFDGSQSSSNTAQNITNTLVEWNTIGDSSSCTSPTNGMNYTGTLVGMTVVDNYGGNCAGITVSSTVGLGATGTSSSYGLKILNNNFVHLGEGVHVACPNPPGSNSNGVCEPASSTAGSFGSGAGSAVTTQYLTAEFNDFNQIHRIAWEQQPQITGAVVVDHNSMHDWYNPYFGSFGMSFACCDGLGANIPYSPYLDASNNVIAFNATSNPSGFGGIGSPAVGYMVEAWGYGAGYLNNLYEAGSNTTEVTWGFGGGTWSISNNTFCGAGYGGSYITNEFGQSNTPTEAGNATSSGACSAVTSVAPTISPAAGFNTFPISVTITDPGFTTGAKPLGNHSIYYTTDGSTPTVSSALYTSPITLTSAATVKAIGMWGTGANTTNWPSGYGFVPSAVVSSAFTTSGNVCSTVASGASTATIQSALNACGSGKTLAFANGGSWTISGTHLNIPCGVSMSGPAVPFPGPWTASFISTLGTDWAFYLPNTGCTTPMSITDINCDGGEPSGGGGGCIYFPNSGGANVTITNNNIHGNQASTTTSHTQSSLIWVDGVNNSSNKTWSNVTITWNLLGAGSDCSNVMALYNYQGANYDSSGGQCAGLGLHSSTTNFVFQNNVVAHQEQGVKIYEGSGQNNPCTNVQYCDSNSLFQYNDFSFIHRIVIEAQATPSPNMYFQYNSVHDQVNPGFGSWQFSIPQYANNGQTINTYGRYNVMLGNVAPTSGGGNYFPSAFELWGTGAADYNLVQGKMACGIDWGYGASPWSISNNIIQVTSGNTFICNEENQSNQPTETGNSTSNTIVAQTSQMPTISPASGTFATSQVVTFNCAACTLRDANTGIWYTTDGTTPVPGSGTAKYIAIGGTITLTSPGTTTVRAVGMWGSFNQPTSYPSGYGYVPSAVSSAVYSSGGGYFISPTGSDSNNGTSASTPWLTPNHSLNCGDVITAAAGNYSAANFGRGKWGPVSCAANNNVAWLQCATFDTCKISVTSGTAQPMIIDRSYWGVKGWENSSSASVTFGSCFTATPSGSSSIHHIIFANDIANGCAIAGFEAYSLSNTASVDYVAFIGDIAYNSAQGTNVCGSGFSVYQPIAADTAPGTHIYMAGNFSWANTNGNNCGGNTGTTDGEGYNFDTWDFSHGGGTPYTQQGAIENNIEFLNGGYGIEVENNAAGSTHAPIFIQNNTMYGDKRDVNGEFCFGNGDLHIYNSLNVNIQNNLTYTGFASDCPSPGAGGAFYAFAIGNGDGSDVYDNNYASGVSGNNTFISASTGFSLGTHNIIGTNPAFANPVNPGAPSCSSFSSVPACMASVIADYTPTVSAAATYGYQQPSSSPVVDALYPAWLCNVSLPSGLVSSGCATGGPSLTGGFQGNTGSINTLAVGASPIQQTAHGSYTDSVNRTLPDAFGNTAVWSSSDFTILNVTTTGLVSCIKAGSANSKVSSSPGGVAFNVWGWTCTGSAPSLTGGFLGNVGSINTLAVGAMAIPFTATGTYSDSANRTEPDVYGNTVTWSSSDNTILTVSSSGAASCVATGTADVIATSSPGLVGFSHWTMTCTSPTTPSGAYQGNVGSVNLLQLGQSPVQQHAFCVYPDTVVLDCTNGDARGNTVTAWSVSFAGIAIGAAGGPTSGQITTLEEGTVSSGCTVTGGATCALWTWTVQFPTRTQMPISGMTINGMKTQ